MHRTTLCKIELFSWENPCLHYNLPDIFYPTGDLQRQTEVTPVLNHPLYVEHCTNISQVTNYYVAEHRI